MKSDGRRYDHAHALTAIQRRRVVSPLDPYETVIAVLYQVAKASTLCIHNWLAKFGYQRSFDAREVERESHPREKRGAKRFAGNRSVRHGLSL